MDLLNLPLVVLENIFSYLSYDEIAKSRIICRVFDEVCQRMLNRGFIMIERRHGLALKNVKAQLPRRESERRYHPLSRHCDILSSIETRISMLNMTYSKFIDSGLCCFIPGKVIDEIKRVLLLVEKSTTPPRAHEVLQELRDISSMAIEHFDDKVSPAFRKLLHDSAAAVCRAAPRPDVFTPLALRQELFTMRRRSIVNTRLSLHLASQYKKFIRQIAHYKQVNKKQRKIIRDLNKRQNDQDASIADLKKRIEECDIKYSEITHTNQPGKAISASSPGVSAAPTQPLRHFASQIKLDLSVLPIGTSKRNQRGPNIKPRKSAVKLPTPTPTDEIPDNATETPNPLTPSTPQTPKSQEKQSPLNTIKKYEMDLKNMCKNDVLINRSGKRSLSLNALDDEGTSKRFKMD